MNVTFRCLAAIACFHLPATAAITLTMSEDFSGTHDWSSGDPNPNPPVRVADAGPLGAGDAALRVTANGGSSAGGRLVVFNDTRWTGDYAAAGVFQIAADLRNNGTTLLSMRLALNGPGGWWVTPAAPLTAFSGWNRQLFDIGPGALVSAGGGNVSATLASVSELRILHSSGIDFRGARISSGFTVDNVQAVPEPTAALLLILSGTFFIFRKR